jgi:hypothetical protein
MVGEIFDNDRILIVDNYFLALLNTLEMAYINPSMRIEVLSGRCEHAPAYRAEFRSSYFTEADLQTVDRSES